MFYLCLVNTDTFTKKHVIQMIKKRFLFLSLVMIARLASADTHLDSLLNVLDQTIAGHEVYAQKREARIRQLKHNSAETEPFSVERYDLNMQLFDEYKAYICDSAIHYLNENISIAGRLNDTDRADQSRLELSYLLSSSGMYKEAVDLLEAVDRKTLNPKYIIKYYYCYDRAYGEMGVYTQDEVSSDRYWRISQAYRDSLKQTLDPQSEDYLALTEDKLRDDKKFDEALKLNDVRMAEAVFGTPQYAIATYYRAIIFQQQGDTEREKYYLALSAISDIQSATKDHASLWMLAQVIYEEGDVERAYRYMRFSWNETKFYNARLRSWQSADVLSLIDKTYQAMIEKQNGLLEQYAYLITILLILLLVALIYIYRQVKKLSVARNHLQSANSQLNALNGELSTMNTCLQSTNLELSESNQIKEEYIARFVKLCSTYIDKLDAYRRMVNKKISAGQTADLLKITRSQDALDKELEELFVNFDTTFLHIFPDFVKKFNALLQDDGKIILKRGELLNTELRIFALIRLGIEDSSQIAEFLRYSVNTIYNYRSKVKNKACVSRDDFEERVKEIR